MSATASAKGTANPMRRTAEHDYVTNLTQNRDSPRFIDHARLCACDLHEFDDHFRQAGKPSEYYRCA